MYKVNILKVIDKIDYRLNKFNRIDLEVLLLYE